MRSIRIIMQIAVLLAVVGCSQAQKKSVEKKPFSVPELPAIITTEQGRADFYAIHYWDNYDFSDTSLINKPEVSEQIFVDYIVGVLPYCTKETVKAGVDTLLSRSFLHDSTVFAHMMEISEKYLYEPNSPFMNEALYIPFLEYVVNSSKVGAVDKVRPKYQLELAYKNRIGETSIDFEYITSQGQKGTLHSIKSAFTVIYFNNPGCLECKRTSEYAQESSVIKSALAKSSGSYFKILAVYPDNDLQAWKKEKYSPQWINARAAEGFKNSDNYDLKAIPCLYLLDKDKKVILKDVPIEKIEAWLTENANL